MNLCPLQYYLPWCPHPSMWGSIPDQYIDCPDIQSCAFSMHACHDERLGRPWSCKDPCTLWHCIVHDSNRCHCTAWPNGDWIDAAGAKSTLLNALSSVYMWLVSYEFLYTIRIGNWKTMDPNMHKLILINRSDIPTIKKIPAPLTIKQMLALPPIAHPQLAKTSTYPMCHMQV